MNYVVFLKKCVAFLHEFVVLCASAMRVAFSVPKLHINCVKGNIMTTKKLLPTVIGMILAGGVAVAQADVQLMGHIDEALAYVNGGQIKHSGGDNFYDGTHGTPKLVSRGNNNTQLVCTTCSVGVRGSEDLGNGLKALFFLDWQYDINGNDNGGLTGRDQWLGLGGSFGTLKAGTMSTVYKAYGAMVDPVYRTIAQQRNVGLQSNLHNGRGSAGEGRATNTVGYETPDWKGLKLNATYTIVNDSAKPRNPNPYSVGAMYENGGLLGYVTYLNNNTNGDDAATAVGAKYTFDKLSVFGQYEFDQGLITDTSTGTLGQKNSGDGADVWMVGGTYTMGNNMLYAGYGQGNNAKTTDATIAVPPAANQNVIRDSYKSWELVGAHNFSKRTMVYAGYVGQKVDGKVNGNDIENLGIYTVGMKHTF
jgi:GBP family porin